jgi:hypothetical protein
MKNSRRGGADGGEDAFMAIDDVPKEVVAPSGGVLAMTFLGSPADLASSRLAAPKQHLFLCP